jgi:transcriptional activator SPT7
MILHTLFESGITKVQDLENYVQEDIVHFGSRMGEIEKKLTTAYSDAAAALAGEGIVDDDQLFAEGDEDEGAFVMGGFAEAFGEDFLGLKALGIADEFGLSSLSIPRKLLRMRKARLDAERAKADQLDEILPYPLPPPLLPLRGDQIGHQIGLLRPFLENKFKALAVQQAAPPPPPSPSAAPPPPLLGPPALTGPSLLAPPALTGPPSLKPPTLTGPSSLSGPIINGLPPAPATAAPPISPLATPSSATTPSLPTMSSAVLEPQPMPPPPPLEVDPASLVMTDELPLASRCKLGSLGQVVKPGHAGGGSKKKGGSKASGAGAGAGGDGSAGSGNKGGSGAGKDGGGSKKKDKDKEGGGGGGGSKSKKAKVKMEGDGDGTSWDGRGSVAPSESPSSPKKIGRPPGRPPLAEGQKKKKPSKKKGAAAGGGEVQLPSMVAASA